MTQDDTETVQGIRYPASSWGWKPFPWVMGCSCFPCDAALLYFSQNWSWTEVWFRQTVQSFASWCQVSFMCLYVANLICIFSGVASSWPPCHLAQICEEFHWLLSFQKDRPLQEAAVCSAARAVRGAFLWPKFICGGFSVWSEHRLW